MLNTSGVMVTHKEDGGILVEYCDYGVSEFGGGDYEVRYTFNKDDADRLIKALGERSELKHILADKFGRSFDACAFESFCKQIGANYSRTSWISR